MILNKDSGCLSVGHLTSKVKWSRYNFLSVFLLHLLELSDIFHLARADIHSLNLVKSKFV